MAVLRDVHIPSDFKELSSCCINEMLCFEGRTSGLVTVLTYMWCGKTKRKYSDHMCIYRGADKS